MNDTDDRPSIAELQRRPMGSAAMHQIPVLLEIAAAALAFLSSDDEDRAAEIDDLIAAAAKVRP